MSDPNTSMYPAAKLLYETGVALVADDASDIGHFTYHGRTGHYYHGKHSPNHPSPLHHWQLGTAMAILGQLWGVVEKMKEAQRLMEEAEMLYDDGENQFMNEGNDMSGVEYQPSMGNAQFQTIQYPGYI